jgi:DNA-binding transcriptional MocR family regulator
LLELGFELFCEPKAGMFLWAKHPQLASGAELSYKAAEHDIMLGPGHLFSTDLAPSPWLRFNVAFCTDGDVFSFLEKEALLGRQRSA